MEERITYVGLDVHKEEIVAAVAEGGIGGEVREYGRIANTGGALDRLMRRLGGEGVRLRFCLRGRPVRLWHPTSLVGAWARLRCGGAVADPEAGGRPGQDGSAGCGRSGAAASGG